MDLTRRQMQVATTIGSIRAAIVMSPDASDEARELGKQLDIARGIVSDLLSADRAYLIDAHSWDERDRILRDHGYIYDDRGRGWHKAPTIDPVYVGQ